MRSLPFFFVIAFSDALRNPNPNAIQVCTQKNCRKRGSQALVETFRDLIPPGMDSSVEVRTGGCVTKCGVGPNIAISAGKSYAEYSGVADPTTASAILEIALEIETPPAILVSVLEMARATKAQSRDERLSILTAVVDKLTPAADGSGPGPSHALASALATLAEIHLAHSPPDVDAALSDARAACLACGDHRRALRTLARAEEAAGNFAEAVDAIRRWSETSDSPGDMGTKSEIRRIAGLAA